MQQRSAGSKGIRDVAVHGHCLNCKATSVARENYLFSLLSKKSLYLDDGRLFKSVYLYI